MSSASVQLPGVRPDSLGGYLAAIGILRALAQSAEMADARGFWSDGVFAISLQAKSFDYSSLRYYLLAGWDPTTFNKWWGETQKESKERPGAVARARATVSDERVDELDALMVQSNDRRVFNDILGTGGNVGKRNFAAIWKACDAMRHHRRAAGWLDQALLGSDQRFLPKVSGGTWFLSANKAFNSGQSWFREGRLSPWSYLFAMEGARLLRGGLHRRNNGATAGKAVFPFTCRPATPRAASEIGRGKSEFWAPLWKKPATLIEIEALLRAGLAEIGGRPAKAPHEFAVAALAAAVDSGITAFAPFELRQTTSSQTFEAVPRAQIRIGNGQSWRRADLLLPLLKSGWLDRLPSEPAGGKRQGRFTGLRGPVEIAIARVAQQPEDQSAWCALILLLAKTQARIDRNKALRDKCIPLPPLSDRWLDVAWPVAPIEIQLAVAVASIGWPRRPGRAQGLNPPLIENVFGLARTGAVDFSFPTARPARAVWSDAEPVQALSAILQRRLIEAQPGDPAPLGCARPCGPRAVMQFLDAGAKTDLDQICRWVPALSLFAWRPRQPGDTAPDTAVHPLYALFRPILDPGSALVGGRPLFATAPADERAPQSGSARTLINLIANGEVDQAVSFARRKYFAAGWRTAEPPEGEWRTEPKRLAAALLFPLEPKSLARGLLERWNPTSVGK